MPTVIFNGSGGSGSSGGDLTEPNWATWTSGYRNASEGPIVNGPVLDTSAQKYTCYYYAMVVNSSERSTVHIRVQGSNDQSTWTTIADAQGTGYDNGRYQVYGSSDQYRYYRPQVETDMYGGVCGAMLICSGTNQAVHWYDM